MLVPYKVIQLNLYLITIQSFTLATLASVSVHPQISWQQIIPLQVFPCLLADTVLHKLQKLQWGRCTLLHKRIQMLSGG